jgi:hypothetical protein
MKQFYRFLGLLSLYSLFVVLAVTKCGAKPDVETNPPGIPHKNEINLQSHVLLVSTVDKAEVAADIAPVESGYLNGRKVDFKNRDSFFYPEDETPALEPGALAIFFLGLIGFVAVVRRKLVEST